MRVLFLYPKFDICNFSLLPQPQLIVFTGEGIIIVSYVGGLLCNFTMNGRSLKKRRIDDSIKVKGYIIF